MRKLSLCLASVLILTVSGFAQHGEYVRKSITSVESVWVHPGSERGISLDYPFFEKMVEAYIEMPRFDYNQLPDTLLREFRRKANRLSSLNESMLAELLEETVGEEIRNILNDPEIMENRGLALRDESAWQTFAATKARSIGLTVEELEILMNSSYIYLPFIRSIRLSDSPPSALAAALQSASDSDNHYVSIEGGIVWFAVSVSPSGEVSVNKRLAVSADAYGSAEKGSRNTFQFGNERWALNARDYALYNATQAWVRNLAVKTQEIPDFRLSASIIEVRPPRRYSLPIGKREGVYLDDMYELVEVRMTPDGEERAERVGFTRITQVGDNTEDHYNYSTAAQLFGPRQSVGVVAREYPRVGYDLRFTMGVAQGHLIPANDFSWLATDITESVTFDLSYAYNLAPLTGTSQSFLSIDLGFGIPVNYETQPGYSETAPVLAHLYLGYTKKYWLGGRHHFGLQFGAGSDLFRYSIDTDNSLTLFAPGGRAGLSYEILMSPAWSFTIGAGYKFTTNPFWASWEVDGQSYEFAVGDTDIFLGGSYFTAGFNYSLRQIGVNLFGFLDGFREY